MRWAGTEKSVHLFVSAVSNRLFPPSPLFLLFVAGRFNGQPMARTLGTYVGEGAPSYDGTFEKDRIKKKAGDPTRREFTYFMLGGGRFIYASAARLALIKVSNTVG